MEVNVCRFHGSSGHFHVWEIATHTPTAHLQYLHTHHTPIQTYPNKRASNPSPSLTPPPPSHDAEFPHTEPRGVHAPSLVDGLLEVGKETEHLFLLRDVVRDAAALPSPAGHARARGARPGAVSVSAQDWLGLGRSDHPR